MKRKTSAKIAAVAVAVAAAAAVTLVLSAGSASPPALLKADGVERVLADRSAYPAELAQLRDVGAKAGRRAPGGRRRRRKRKRGRLPGQPADCPGHAAGRGVRRNGRRDGPCLGLPAEHRDEAGNALLASLEAFDGDPGSVDEKNPPRRPVLHTANGLFVDKGVPTGEGYLRSLARYYGTGVYPVDFQDEAATKPAIDAWVNKNTGGRIKKAPAEYRPRQYLQRAQRGVLRLGLEGALRPGRHLRQPFTTADGRQVSVPTMSGVQDIASARGPAGRPWNCRTPRVS